MRVRERQSVLPPARAGTRKDYALQAAALRSQLPEQAKEALGRPFLVVFRLLFFWYFGYIFTGFSTDRSTKYVKIVNNDTKIDRVDP